MKQFTLFVSFATASWMGLWLTPDQQGQRLFNDGNFEQAAELFRDPMRQGAALFRAGEFEQAEQAYARIATPEAEYNRGNCLIMRGKYEAAIERFDRALELRPDWEDAEINRRIAVARAEMVKQEGGDMGDQKLGADDVVFDKNKKNDEGQDTDVQTEQVMSDSAMQEMWLRRVNTQPSDFLKSKFAYQLGAESEVSE